MRHLFTAVLLGCTLALPLRAEIPITPVLTPDGHSAWLVEEPSIPFLALELSFDGGTSLDPAGQEGVVSLMTDLLSQGAGDLDAQSFAEATEALAARFRFDASRDGVRVSAQFLTENRDEAVDLLRLALTEPRLDADAIERRRAQKLASLRRDALDPNSIASAEFARLAWGDHPYGRPGDGTVDTVSALDADTLRAAHRAALVRDRVHVGAAGDITAEELGPLIDRLLSGLPTADTPLPEPATFQAEAGRTVVPFDGPQAVIAFGHAGIARDDPEFLAAFVLNEAFGGGRFGTRLMTSLREERGLTYGVGTGLASGALGASFQGRLSTENARVDDAIALIVAEWQAIAETGLTEAEFNRVRTYLTGAYPLRFDGNGAIARTLASMQAQGFDIDYVNVRNDLVRALTLDQINAMAERLFDPAALHFVIVGQPPESG